MKKHWQQGTRYEIWVDNRKATSRTLDNAEFVTLYVNHGHHYLATRDNGYDYGKVSFNIEAGKTLCIQANMGALSKCEIIPEGTALTHLSSLIHAGTFDVESPTE